MTALTTTALDANTPVTLVSNPTGDYFLVGEPLQYRVKDTGRTDCPPPSQGVAPWSRTGQRRYQWTITHDASLTVSSSPVAGTITTFDTINIKTGGDGGELSVTANLQEEWRDATGKTVYWPPFSSKD